MGYVDDAFDNLKRTLEITDTEQALAQSRQRLLRDHIAASWHLSDDFLTGSYARHTKTKKLKDVDLFVVIDPSGPQGSFANNSPTEALTQLRDLLATRWSNLFVDDNVVRVDYSGEDVASYEVAPVFERDGGGYLMPNAGAWMATDPTKHKALVTEKNAECDDKFVPFVKMIKGINRNFDEPITPPFLLEVMALEIVMTPFGRYRDEIRFFLATAADRITEDWPDPAKLGVPVNHGVTASERTVLAAVLREWLTIAEDALALERAGKERAAVERWRQLFGWRMPRP
jgi:hypothetical protein